MYLLTHFLSTKTQRRKIMSNKISIPKGGGSRLSPNFPKPSNNIEQRGSGARNSGNPRPPQKPTK